MLASLITLLMVVVILVIAFLCYCRSAIHYSRCRRKSDGRGAFALILSSGIVSLTLLIVVAIVVAYFKIK